MVERKTPSSTIVTSPGSTSECGEPASAPLRSISAMVAVMRSRVAGVAMPPDAQPARSVPDMPRLILKNSAYRVIHARRAAEGSSSARSAGARELGVTPAQVGLAWLLHHSPNVLLIPGTADPGHLEANVAAGAVALDEATLSALDAVPSRSGGIVFD